MQNNRNSYANIPFTVFYGTVHQTFLSFSIQFHILCFQSFVPENQVDFFFLHYTFYLKSYIIFYGGSFMKRWSFHVASIIFIWK